MRRERLPAGLLLARVEDLPDAGARVIEVEHDGLRTSLILARKGGAISAFINECPHAGYPLQRADGVILIQEGRFMVCGAHGASFKLENGACAGGPCNGDGLERVAIKIKHGEVRTA
jgi:nitrite reductase/ring-hydroxylating ferredoxin subunit